MGRRIESESEHSSQRVIKDENAYVKIDQKRLLKLITGCIEIKIHIVYVCIFIV